jgi:hypothetical protein
VDKSTPIQRQVPSPFQRRQLSVATVGIDERTILRAYRDPSRVRESTRLRLAEAASKLGLPVPPSPVVVVR